MPMMLVAGLGLRTVDGILDMFDCCILGCALTRPKCLAQWSFQGMQRNSKCFLKSDANQCQVLL